MKKTLYLSAALVSGIAAGLTFALIYEDTTTSLPTSGNSLEQAITDLNNQLSREKMEREAIRSELATLQQGITELQLQQDRTAPVRDQISERLAEAASEQPQDNQELLRQDFAHLQRMNQEERYIDAGISAGRAQWIMQREEELEWEMLQARYDAVMNGEEEDFPDADDILRQELGDDEYEKYLEANRRPTSISIREVMGSSPAEIAGLRPGDQIVRYDGNRVFEMGELTDMTYNGKAGETVAVEVVRDGQSVQIYIPRGPLGISGGGRVRRR